MGAECTEDRATFFLGQNASEGRVLPKLDGQGSCRRQGLEDRLGATVKHGLPSIQPVQAHASRVHTSQAVQIRPGTLQCARWIGRKVTGNRAMEPQRLELIPIQSRR